MKTSKVGGAGGFDHVFAVEEDVQTMKSSKTLTLDSKTNQIILIAVE